MKLPTESQASAIRGLFEGSMLSHIRTLGFADFEAFIDSRSSAASDNTPSKLDAELDIAVHLDLAVAYAEMGLMLDSLVEAAGTAIRIADDDDDQLERAAALILTPMSPSRLARLQAALSII